MHIETSAVTFLSPPAARRCMGDPAILRKILPACVGIAAEARPWVASFDAAFMGFHERFDVELDLREVPRDETLHLHFATSTRMGRAEGEGVVGFAPDADGTRLDMKGNVEVTGLLAALGEGLLRRAANEIITRALHRLEEMQGKPVRDANI